MSVANENAPAGAASPGAGRSSRMAGPLLLLIGVALTVAGGLWTDRFQPLPDPGKAVTGLRWWFTPVERNAFMRMPAIQGHLYGVDALSADVVWAVGERGLIIGTTDGGRTWRRGTIVSGAPAVKPNAATAASATDRSNNSSWSLIRAADAAQPPNPRATLPAAQYNPKAAADAAAQNAAATQNTKQAAPRAPPDISAGDVTQQSPPASKGDVTQRSPPPSKKAEPADTRQQKAAPASPDSGAGDSNADSAAQKSPPAEPTPLALLDVKLLSPTVGVAVGEQGTIVRTEDGGATWHLMRSSAARDLHSLTQTSTGRLVAVGTGGGVQTSDDQGVSWSPHDVDLPIELFAVAFPDARTGVAVGAQGIIFRTLDGGDNWTRVQSTATPTSLYGVAFVDSQTLVAVGGQRAIVRSVDAGETWSAVATPAGEQALDDVTFIDSRRGFALGRATGFITENGGASWTEISSPCAVDEECNAAAAPADGTAYAIGQTGLIARSRTAGAQWSVMSAGRAFRGMAFADARDGAVVGRDGTILITRDAGATWAPRQSGVSAALSAVDFASANDGVAVGSKGTVLLTRDRGESWSIRPFEPRVDLVDVDFTDALHGLAVTASRTVSRTDDAGMTWSAPQDWNSNPNDVAVASVLPLPRRNITARFPVARGNQRAEATVTMPSALYLDGSAGQMLQTLQIDPSLPWGKISAAAFNDALLGIAVGKKGTVLRSEDNGAHWQPASLATPLDLLAVRFTDSTRAVALAAERIFTTDDAGKTWSPVTYRRYPSPWLWLAGFALLSASALLLKWRLTSADEGTKVQQSVADAAVSDSPIGWKDPDAVGLRDIALGLSRFLRNRRTQPPLTIAVTGEWGTGKSSLMNLLKEDLQRYGFRPVWFNAWHHQSGENLLGSLLANIHAQGVPPWITLPGLDFRLSLLFVRIRRFWLRLALTLLALAIVFFSYDVLGKNAVTLWKALSSDGSFDLGNLGAATGLIGLLAAVLTPLLGALRAVSAFGLQPGKLIAAVATTGQDETARLEPGARYRFAREFRDFASALDPRTLVIFIDDLDRCRPPNVIEVLEAVNFLVSSGRCVVVLGMARRWVEACVGKEFDELAAATADESESDDSAVQPAAPARVQPVDETQARNLEQRQFARNYLEKLINIEIRVPRLTDQASLTILESSAARPAAPGWRRTLGKGLLGVAPAFVVVAVAIAVVLVGRFVADELKTLDAMVATRTAATRQQKIQAAQPADRTPGSEAPKPPATDEDNTQAIALDSSHVASSTGWYVGTGVPAVATLAILLGLLLFVRKGTRTDDSPAFREALATLQPWIVLGGHSPRSLKRFVNHLRYVAMRFRSAVEPQSFWERMSSTVAHWFDGGEPPAPAAPPTRIALEECLLVALAAIYRCNERWLDELIKVPPGRIASLLERDFAERLPDAAERAAVAAKLEKSLEVFNTKFPKTPLFRNEMLDRGYAVAFYDVMATEAGSREHTGIEDASPPTQLRPTKPSAA